MIVEDNEETLVEVMVFCKLRPVALEIHLAVPVIPDLHFIGISFPECSQRIASRSYHPSINLVNFSGTC
jgi:hypothetical protein